MGRKLVYAITMILLVVSFTIPVSAASGIIRVDIGGDGEVAIYTVGRIEDGGYRLSEQYGGGFLTFDDILSDNLAAWLAQRASDGISRETEEGIAVFEGLAEGLYLVVQTKALPDGRSFEPFLLSLPWDGYLWAADIAPEMELQRDAMPQTGDAGFLMQGVLGIFFSLLGIAVWKGRYAQLGNCADNKSDAS